MDGGLTPPLSGSDDDSSLGHPRCRGTECGGVPSVTEIAGGRSPTGNVSDQGFISLYEESYELEKTEHHFPSLPKFIENLQLAYKARWNTRHMPYEKVTALLIYWEDDDLGVIKEIDDLKHVMSETYRFDVDTWAIISTKSRYESLVGKIQNILKENDSEGNLIILYYGGHAYQEGQSQPIWVS
jgi:hypothetical protein